MRKLAGIALLVASSLSVAAPAWSQQGQRNLWIAKFDCDAKAAAAVASIQQSDAAALQYSGLFKNITSFTTDSKQPAGTWSLSSTEVSYSGGSTAKRVLVGFGTGRAHVVMQYQLRNPEGDVVWSQKIKSEPSLWSSGGSLGAVQNQDASMSKQSEKLIDALAKFFNGKN
ncbi:MAG TPA: DUF4410 domain-containing protein [Candidatus Acidoferrales bacterium]|nr:DUF4410 domain-containing protein [Candidatus Acidoferrales bacterium]